MNVKMNLEMASIENTRAREILDSRGNLTVEAEVILVGGTTGVAAVPSGASVGKHEAVELRDGDDKRYHRQCMLKAISHVNDDIAARVEGMSALEQAAVDSAGYEAGKECFIALDPAASNFYQDGKYVLRREGANMPTGDIIDYYAKLVSKYPIISIEDGLAEDDWAGWILLTARLGKEVQPVGDDIYVTNAERLERGIDEKPSNSVLIKPNQIGMLSETLAVVREAQKAEWTTIISHCSGETEDTTIADLAVAVDAPFIKSGAPCCSERPAKYNRLLRIELELGTQARYPGPEALHLEKKLWK